MAAMSAILEKKRKTFYTEEAITPEMLLLTKVFAIVHAFQYQVVIQQHIGSRILMYNKLLLTKHCETLVLHCIVEPNSPSRAV